jgi:hypothetical protein
LLDRSVQDGRAATVEGMGQWGDRMDPLETVVLKG